MLRYQRIVPELQATASDKVFRQKIKDAVFLKAQNKYILFNIADGEDLRKVDIPVENGLTHALSLCFSSADGGMCA